MIRYSKPWPNSADLALNVEKGAPVILSKAKDLTIFRRNVVIAIGLAACAVFLAALAYSVVFDMTQAASDPSSYQFGSEAFVGKGAAAKNLAEYLSSSGIILAVCAWFSGAAAATAVIVFKKGFNRAARH